MRKLPQVVAGLVQALRRVDNLDYRRTYAVRIIRAKVATRGGGVCAGIEALIILAVAVRMQFVQYVRTLSYVTFIVLR